MKNFYLILGFLLLLFQQPLQAVTFSLGSSLGVTSYNTGFYLKDTEDKFKKLLPAPLFAPLLNLDFTWHVTKRWRLGVSGAFRYRIPFLTSPREIVKDRDLQMAGSFKTSSVSLHVLYEIPQSLRYKSFFGISGGYSKTFMESLEILFKPENGETYKQIVPTKDREAFIFKIIAGQSFHIANGFYLELTFAFSPIEWLVTEDQASLDEIPKDFIGEWDLEPPYEFPIRPLDISFGVRQQISF